jgi:magnesium-transporting ATPase (P-type)
MILGAFGGPQLIIIVVYFLFIIGLITVNVFYLINLSETLKEVDESRRKVPTSNVWLMLIPLFNLVYPFILYPRVSESLNEEFEYRGLPKEGDFGKSLGTAMGILSLVSIIPFIGFLCLIAYIIILVIYWQKMSGYKQLLRNNKML